MINHVRTLLLNCGRDGHSPTGPGEEYVPRSYRPRRLSGAVQRAMLFLFGAKPDRLFCNYRLHQILTLLHTSELAPFLLRQDTRITYWPFDASLFSVVFGVTVQPAPGTGAMPFVTGLAACDEGTGRCDHEWRVRILTGSRIRAEPRIAGVAPVEQALAFSSGLSVPLNLPGSGLTLRCRDDVQAGNNWAITSKSRPQTDFGEVLAGLIAVLGDTAIMDLLTGTDPAVETWRQVWMHHSVSVNRYAALLLALAAAVEQSPPEN